MKKSIFEHIKKRAEAIGLELIQIEPDGTALFTNGKDKLVISTTDLYDYYLSKYTESMGSTPVAVFLIPEHIEDFDTIADLLDIFQITRAIQP